MAIIALDIMGDPTAPAAAIEAALRIIKARPDIIIHLVGTKEEIEQHLPLPNYAKGRIIVHYAENAVLPTDEPKSALRFKKQSSMAITSRLVASGEADVAVSSGPTGALIATATHYLKRVNRVKAPALTARVPSIFGEVLLLDVGAVANTSIVHLLQFVIMGHVYAREVLGIPVPRIGILNVGEEKHKGDDVTVAAYQTLERVNFPGFVGNVEPAHIYFGKDFKKVDIVIGQGVPGNIYIKTASATIKFMVKLLINALASTSAKKLLLLLAALTSPFLTILLIISFLSLKSRINPNKYNGAPVFGLEEMMIKAHGNSPIEGFIEVLRLASEVAARPKLGEILASELADWMPKLLPPEEK